ncbi:hypothetical protein B7494_g2325 [Chlorociboria aeruginascens]|nr:hypothetical protein B7494_g2325 [Chlorociboria aeruginascens]
MAPLSLRLCLLRAQPHPSQIHPRSFPIRAFSHSMPAKYPRKDSQDRNSINTEATEGSKSGTDDEAARQEDAAFNPEKTAPEEEKRVGGKGNEKSGNPLEVSGANQDVSKPNKKTKGE